MDWAIRRFDAIPKDDLAYCEHRGIAYQRDMKAGRVRYDDKYYAKVAAYEGTEVAQQVNSGRVAMVKRHLPVGKVFDQGAGTGDFLRAAISGGFPESKGTDVMPASIHTLKLHSMFASSSDGFNAVTAWDVLEHMEKPDEFLRALPKGSLLFVSVPIFNSLDEIKKSKHYRPGEHLYYWTEQGLKDWMSIYEYRCLETSWHEVEAGRVGILAFAFKRDMPDYNDHVAAYQQIHSTKHYGSSSTELHLGSAAEVVRKLKPKSIIDYGCGRSDLVTHFWRDGERRIFRYDPAIPTFFDRPKERYELAFCCDVMEHIPMLYVEKVLREVRTYSDRCFFTISTKLARAKLPDGRNSHVTILKHSEWQRWIADVFGSTRVLPSQWEHELILLAGAGP